MVKVLLLLAKMLRSVPVFEFVGAGLVIAGVWIAAGMPYGLITAGGLALLKSLDLSLQGDESSGERP